MSIAVTDTERHFFRQWLLLLAALLTLGGLIAYSQWRDYRGIDQRERERLATQATVIEKNVVPHIVLANRVIENILATLPSWQSERDHFKHANRQLRDIDATLIGISPILIIDAKGAVIASSEDQLIGLNVAERDYFQTASRNPDPSILHLAAPFKTVRNRLVISLFRTIAGPQGEFAGLVLVSADPEYFSTLLDSVRYAADVRSSITHGDGKIFLTAPAVAELHGLDTAQPDSFFTRHLESGQAGTVFVGTAHATGEQRMMAQRTIQLAAPPMDKILVANVGRDLDVIYAPWRKNLLIQGLLYCVIALLSMLGLLSLQQRRREQIAEHDRARAALRDSDMAYHSILETTLDGYWLVSRDGRLLDVNQAYCLQSGYARDELLQMRVTDLESAESADETKKHMLAVIERGSDQFESTHHRKDGTLWDVDISVSYRDRAGGQFVALLRDISERRAIFGALRTSEQRFRSFVENANDVLFALTPEGIFNYVSPRWTEAFGYEIDETIGKSFQLFVHPDDVQGCLEFLQTTLAGGKKQSGVEYRVLCKDGTLRWYKANGSVIQGSGNGAPTLFGIGRDITELKRFEEDLISAKQTAEAANLAKSRFLAAASHDLRQPIQAINLFHDALARTGLNPEQQRISDYLSLSAQSLGDLLNALLDISKLDAGSVKPFLEPLPVEELFRGIDAEFSPLARAKGLRFRLAFPLGDLAVVTDPKLLQSLLGNLIGNAIKYTEQGGLLVGLRRRGNQALIQVWDTGIGIAEEHLDTIYEEYFQIGNPERDRNKGLGLGLSIAQRLAHLLATEVVCHSRPGQGSVFEFRLPLATEPIPVVAAAPAPTTLDAKQLDQFRGRHAVVIEDDALVATALQLSLESIGLAVTAHRRAEEALADASIINADFYISDFRLPGMNGLELLDEIQRRVGKPIRAALMTGDKAPDAAGIAAAQRWTMLLKPVTLPELVATLATLNFRS